jgi:hypothetical protein
MSRPYRATNIFFVPPEPRGAAPGWYDIAPSGRHSSFRESGERTFLENEGPVWVMPAQAGALLVTESKAMGPRMRGDDKKK